MGVEVTLKGIVRLDLSRKSAWAIAAALALCVGGYQPAYALGQAVGGAQTSAPIETPNAPKITLLIQLHMAALAIANLTGDYAALQDLGTPAFQAANPAASLAERFRQFRTSRIDISPVLLNAPRLVGKPAVDRSGGLILDGFYPTSPQRVVFRLGFASVDGNWRLASIQVTTVLGATSAPAPSPKKAAP